jgi:hypothetical protein
MPYYSKLTAEADSYLRLTIVQLVHERISVGTGLWHAGRLVARILSYGGLSYRRRGREKHGGTKMGLWGGPKRASSDEEPTFTLYCKYLTHTYNLHL